MTARDQGSAPEPVERLAALLDKMPTRFSDYDGREVTPEIQAAWLLPRLARTPQGEQP